MKTATRQRTSCFSRCSRFSCKAFDLGLNFFFDDNPAAAAAVVVVVVVVAGPALAPLEA